MKTLAAALLLPVVLLAACKKKEVPPAEATPVASVAAAPAPVADPANMSAEQKEMADKKEKMDFAVMEDKYINDARAQWAETGTGTSNYGGRTGKNATGKVDGEYWENDQYDIGFDSLELGYARPVNASEVRIVFHQGSGVQAINKLELQDTDGKWNTVWSGISEMKDDRRGQRTWFVRSFDKTPYKARAVRFTLANNVESGHKEVDAVQLVGE